MNAALLALCALLLAPTDAVAHRVNIFAWLDGNTVQVQAGFSRKKPARQAAVTVLSGSEADGVTASILLTGATDENGTFSFPLPAEAREYGMTIRINAGQGHQNEWRMKPEDCAAAVPVANVQAAPRPAPVPPQLADDAPRLRDIIGGLGWIVGLVGIGMAVHARRRRV